MLPIRSNTNQDGAVPYSSNAIVWQGPDLECINLCKGDTISDVTAKLAEKLCDLVGQATIEPIDGENGYDLTCLSPVCPRLENQHDLIQFLVDKICTLDSQIISLQDQIDNPPVVECPSCLVEVNPLYNAAPYNLVDAFGVPIEEMQIQDYVKFIANTVLANP